MTKFWKNVFVIALRNRKSIVGAILILSIGIMLFVGMIDSVISTEYSKDDYFGKCNLSDVFADVVGMPKSMIASLKSIDGVEDVQGKLTANVRVVDQNLDRILTIYAVGYEQDETINRILFSGAPPVGNQIYLGIKMMEQCGYKNGDIIRLANGSETMEFEVVGTCQCPLFLDMAPAGSVVADQKVYDMACMSSSALEMLTGMYDAYCLLGFRLEKGYTYADVRSPILDMIDKYGGKEVCEASENWCIKATNRMLESTEQLGTLFPSMFLAVSVFMLCVILRKMISKESTLIGTMKSFGMKDWEMISAYLAEGAIIGALSAILGNGLAPFVGKLVYMDNVDSYRFPHVFYEIDVRVRQISFGIAILAGMISAYLSVKGILKITPAQAMRPPVSTSKINLTLPEFLQKAGYLAKIAVKNITKSPISAFILILAVGFSFGISNASFTIQGAVNHLLDKQYNTVNPFDFNVTLYKGDDPVVVAESATALEYVRYAEACGCYACEIDAGHASKYTNLYAFDDVNTLWPILDVENNSYTADSTGIILHPSLSQKLHVKVGDTVYLKIPEFSEKKVPIKVSAIINQDLGGYAYTGLNFISEMFEIPRNATNILVRAERGMKDPLLHKLKDGKNIKMVTDMEHDRVSFEKNLQTITLIGYVLAMFGLISGFVMIYHVSMINLNDRITELGTMLILGYKERDLALMVIIEQFLYYFAGILLGFPIARYCIKMFNVVLKFDYWTLVFDITFRNSLLVAVFCMCVVLISCIFEYKTIKEIHLPDILKER